MIQIGQSAPSFTLSDQTGSPVTLAGLAGQWVVLYFYPKDDTPGCTTQACDFTAGLAEFQGMNATVVGCSPDSVESHQRFIQKHNLSVRLLSDPDKTALNLYGAWGTKQLYGKPVQGVIRSTVLIAPDGTIAYHWANVKADGHAAAVKQVLADLQAGKPVALPSAGATRTRSAAKAKAPTRINAASGSTTKAKTKARKPAPPKRATGSRTATPARRAAASTRSTTAPRKASARAATAARKTSVRKATARPATGKPATRKAAPRKTATRKPTTRKAAARPAARKPARAGVASRSARTLPRRKK